MNEQVAAVRELVDEWGEMNSDPAHYDLYRRLRAIVGTSDMPVVTPPAQTGSES